MLMVGETPHNTRVWMVGVGVRVYMRACCLAPTLSLQHLTLCTLPSPLHTFLRAPFVPPPPSSLFPPPFLLPLYSAVAYIFAVFRPALFVYVLSLLLNLAARAFEAPLYAGTMSLIQSAVARVNPNATDATMYGVLKIGD